MKNLSTENLQAVFLDWDNTIADTEHLVYESIRHALKQQGHVVDTLPPTQGRSLDGYYKFLLPHATEEQIAELRQTHRDFTHNNIQLTKLFPNSLSVLDSLKAQNKTTIIVTTRFRKSLEMMLEHLKLAHYFDDTITQDDVKIVKPDPEGINIALAKLNLSPKQVVMIGDSKVDVLAGKAANTWTIGVTYGTDGHTITETEPDFIIHDIGELPDLLF